MESLRIVEYTQADNEEALALEAACVQGQSLKLKFLRPSFHARSVVYPVHRILCARQDGRLAGVAAWARKNISLHGRRVEAAYLYDARVHPGFRRKGVAFRLARACFEDIGPDMDLFYTWIAGQNERCLKPAMRLFGMNRMEPFTYLVFPVYRRLRVRTGALASDASEAHRSYLRRHPGVQCVPEWDAGTLVGHVESLKLEPSGRASCSVWSNRGLLEEQVVSVPGAYRWLRIAARPLRPWFPMPHIPEPMETLRSWFLFDVSADCIGDLRELLAVVNNRAFERDIQYLYWLVQDNSPWLAGIRKTGFWTFSFPYCHLAKGDHRPEPGETLYVDVKDL